MVAQTNTTLEEQEWLANSGANTRLGNFGTTREFDTNTTRIYRVWV
jgi:hypothetical protein